MTAGGRQWAIAAALSVSAHLALVAVLARTLAPQPVPPEPTPKARFDLSAQQVEQVAAVPKHAGGAAVPEGQAAAATLPSGTVPSGRAMPLTPSGMPLEAADASAAVVTSQPPQEEAMTDTSPAGAAVKPDVPSAAALATLQPPADAARPAAVTAQAASPLSPPDAVRLERLDPVATNLPATSGQTQSVDVTPIAGVNATAVPLPQTPAAATATGAPRLAPTEPGGTAVASAIPEAAPAPSITAATDRLVTAVTEATALGAAPPQTRIARPTAPSVEPLGAATVGALALAGTVPEGQAAFTALPVLQDVLAAAAEAPVLLGGLPDMPALPTLTPPADDNITQSPTGALAFPAAAASATGERAQAALAWSGDGDGQIDPVSLAAIQSFMQPADLDRLRDTEDPVRDGISALLASVPCARMQTVFLPETGMLEVRGHVPEEELRAPVLTALRGQVGGAIQIADNLRVLPRPQCDVLTGIADLGLPQSTVQETDPRLVGPDAHAREYTYVDGNILRFEVTTPDYPAHVYIDYFDAAGMVLHLQPNEMLDTVLMAPKSTLTVGTDAAGTEIFSITVAPPFGNEIAVAFAASTPIYDAPRPVHEPAGPYLDWLHDRIADARSADPNFKGEWVYFFMSTTPATQ